MKIALFHTTLPEPDRKPGGVEIAVHRLANQLAQDERDEVTVFSLTPSPPDRRYEHVQLFASAPWLVTNMAARLLLLPLVLNRFRMNAFDVVHLHGDDWFYIRRGTASVRTLHGSARFEARSATSLKRKISQYVVYPLEMVARRLATVALAIGPETGRVYSVDALANNGVDPEVFRPGPKTAAPQVLYVGTWEGRKRGKFVFEQFLKHVVPERRDAELVMVCDDVPTHEQVRQVVLPDDETLAALFRESWVFAYPSVYEGFGIPYIEAMSSGTALVCSPNDGADYVLEGGRYAAMVPDDEFGPSVLRTIQDPEYRDAQVAEGLIRAQRFAWAAVAAEHREAYELAVAKRAKRGGRSSKS